jgi:hypothetical protein
MNHADVPRPNSRAPIEDKPPMPKKPGTNPKGEFAFFNVVYEDDSVRSNRRVPNEILGGLKGDEPARGFIMEQDREIAQKSGRPARQAYRAGRREEEVAAPPDRRRIRTGLRANATGLWTTRAPNFGY